MTEYPDEVSAAQPAELEGPADRRAQATIRIQATRGITRLIAPWELLRYRDVAVQMAVRDIKVRYRQTILGASWAVIQPVATMIVFTIIFGKVAKIGSQGVPYWQFSLAGSVPWAFFSSSFLLGSESVTRGAALVSKIYFPRLFIPLGALAAGLVDLAISVTILLVAVSVAGVTPSIKLLVIPCLVAVMVIGTLGIVAASAALNVKYRDVRYAVPFMVQLWLFATPVAYPSSLLHHPWRTLVGLNPMAGVVEGFRWAVLGTPASWSMIATSAGSSVVFFVLGIAYFGKAERKFADLV